MHTEVYSIEERLVPKQNLDLAVGDVIVAGHVGEVGQFVDEEHGPGVADQLQPF